MGAVTKQLTAPVKAAIKPYVNAALEFILGKKGRLKRTEKTQLTRAANKFAKNNSEYTADEFIGLAHKFVKDKKANPIPTKKSGEFKPKKPNPQSTKGKGSKGSNVGLTPAERKEKAGLMAQSRKVAHPQNPLKGSQQFSKAELENMNEAEKLEYALRGIGGSRPAIEAGRKVSGKGSMDAQSKKGGGTVKRNIGGPVRGVGKATRGFGKANYSNKPY